MITSSAVKLEDGRVFVGRRHGDCYLQIKSFGLEQKICINSVQGFITDELEFLNREEGYYHARFNNQCKEQIPFEANYTNGLYMPIEEWKACLFSEDLW